MATIVLGTAFGDEGKGKLVDILSRDVQLCARAQGGHNAGHTVVVDGVSYDFHLHICIDGLEEKELGGRNIGTTKRGIGPTYSSMASRNGITISEMFNEEVFERKLRNLAAGYKKRFGDLLEYDVEEELERFKKYRPDLANYVVDAVPLIADAQKKGSKILVEGCQAMMLDIKFGTYPFVTSSSTGIGGIFTGLALNPRQIDHIIGVVKAYSTRVGSGCLPTELFDEIGEKLPVAYRDPLTGATLESFPADIDLLERVEVVYHEMEGWNQPTTSAKSYYDLPKQARAYIEFIEEFIGVKVTWIGTGPGRDDMIFRGPKALNQEG
ncbi:hypothetical protein DL764_003787 [Monosporascus ibericus]|uniref:Adenylosuccinate synthetase n=1 Tax=Monosporascus ibericus TaxID=155417 RepID=A0A4Q4TFR6_9PEZI|nr:hypothetical protein DL764_003787 [Monosporascus ibericus]